MKSGTSLFNKTISLNLLKRCWPVWTSWLVVLIFALPVNLFSGLSQMAYWDAWHMPLDLWIKQTVLNSACMLAILSFFASIIAVMVMYSFLYNSRTCNMMCSLPVRRETLFTTAWITGIAPMAAGNIIVALITMIAFPGTASPALVLRWLAIVLMANIGFYGFGVFCAMLTGNLFILPLVYAVLNLTAAVVEGAVVGILNALVFGASFIMGRLLPFSPVLFLVENLHTIVSNHNDEMGMIIYDSVELYGVTYLFWFFIAGLVFSVLALLLFRKRRMETASDTVAIPVLKPIFKYCMAFGCALVLSLGIFNLFLSETLRGPSAAVAFALFMIAGAFIGYFAARMIISKSVKVFRGDWKGFAAVAAICLAFVIAAECDITGYEKRLPDLSEVKTVELSMRNYTFLQEKQNIEAVRELQKSVIANKKHHESSDRYMWLTIHYIMEDGSNFSREYRIADAETENFDPGSDVLKTSEIENSVEAILWRNTPEIPVTVDNVYSAYIYNEAVYDMYGNYVEDELKHPEIARELKLTPEEAVALYNECIIPDTMAGRMRDPWIEELKGEPGYSGVNFNMDMIVVPSDGQTDYYKYMTYGGVYISVPESAVLTLARLAELSASD